MDKEFVEKLDAVSVWTKKKDKSDLSEHTISFHEGEDGLVMVSASKGSFEFRLRPLQELFSSTKADTGSMKTDDPAALQLLHAIEGEIKRRYMKNPELTDSSVLLALDTLAMKPEAVSRDVLAKAIQNSLRLLLSTDDYSRDEVKWAIRKILASVKRHKAAGGIRDIWISSWNMFHELNRLLKKSFEWFDRLTTNG